MTCCAGAPVMMAPLESLLPLLRRPFLSTLRSCAVMDGRVLPHGPAGMTCSSSSISVVLIVIICSDQGEGWESEFGAQSAEKC